MEKVCRNWPKEAFDDTLVNEKYWDAFEQNAKAASAEIFRVPDMAAAKSALDKLISELEVKKIIAVGDDEYPGLGKIYSEIKEGGMPIYTEKFEIAEQAPTADLGISAVEFGIGETGSVCADLFSYEARVTSMLPPAHVVFLNPAYMVENVTTAFKMIAKVFKKGYMGFITGPSRTADIERVLSLGVHGPSRFFIIAVEKGFDRGDK